MLKYSILQTSDRARRSLNLREAARADLPAIKSLEAAAATAAHWSDSQYEDLFRAGGVPRLALILEGKDQQPLAFLVAGCPSPKGEIGWEIENIVVNEQYRRRGLGAKLVQELLCRAQAAGAESILLEVRESNVGARAFYEKQGFRIQGRRNNYYTQPQEDAFVYSLKLGILRPSPQMQTLI